MRPSLLVMAPLPIEARALRAGLTDERRAEVVTTGMGPERSTRAAINLAARCAGAGAVAVAGFAGAVGDGVEPGDLVVATELHGPFGVVELPGAAVVAAALARTGARVHAGPIRSVPTVVRGPARAELASEGALAVDMESAWLAEAAAGRPLTVVRAVVDTPAHELVRLGTVAAGVRAYRSLRRAAPVLADWSNSLGPRRVLLAGPRSFCAGVERAIDIVEHALERFGAPVYVRKQIVHNVHVVEALERQGAVFVEELHEVPEGATVVFSAHGVSPAVRRDADDRRLQAIDATCPLVAKVHAESRRFHRQGHSVVLIGHAGHEETEGTLGEVPGIRLVQDVEDVDHLDVPDPGRVAFLSQTTLAVDEVAGMVDRLRERFPEIVGPAADDICYATQNRQEAVRALAEECDAVLVVGSANSSNSNRLVEVARRCGCPAELVDDERDLDLRWLRGAATVGITAGASAPESLVERVTRALATLGPVDVQERVATTEDVQFALPKELR
jgi:4-hydroxy-3-methylbut-2-enyl diphosphate reductase